MCGTHPAPYFRTAMHSPQLHTHTRDNDAADATTAAVASTLIRERRRRSWSLVVVELQVVVSGEVRLVGVGRCL